MAKKTSEKLEDRTPDAGIQLSLEDCKNLIGCMDSAVKQAQDSMATSYKLFPLREKFERHMQILGAEDGDTDAAD